MDNYEDVHHILIKYSLSNTSNLSFSDGRIEKLQDFLAKLYDSPSERMSFQWSSLRMPQDTCTNDLAARYQTVMQTIKKHGYLEASRGK